MPFFSNVNKPNITNAVNARVWAFQKLESFNFNLGNSQNAQKGSKIFGTDDHSLTRLVVGTFFLFWV